MKIRWTKNSIRLRITPGELDALVRHEVIEEELEFGNGGWSVSVGVGTERLFFFERMMAQLRLAEADLGALADPANEGVYLSFDGPQPLRFIIEKDFPCAHPRASEALEPVTETFVPPPDFEARKLQIKPAP